jgi:hypothetical protein
MAGTAIRLKHVGSYAYRGEDAGGELARYANFTLHIADGSRPALSSVGEKLTGTANQPK